MKDKHNNIDDLLRSFLLQCTPLGTSSWIVGGSRYLGLSYSCTDDLIGCIPGHLCQEDIDEKVKCELIIVRLFSGRILLIAEAPLNKVVNHSFHDRLTLEQVYDWAYNCNWESF